jgi:hypothetical protein
MKGSWKRMKNLTNQPYRQSLKSSKELERFQITTLKREDEGNYWILSTSLIMRNSHHFQKIRTNLLKKKRRRNL